MKKLSKTDLDAIVPGTAAKEQYIKVGMSSCGVAAGADKVFAVLDAEVKKRNIPIAVKPCGCRGACYAEPLVEVYVEGLPPIMYGGVTTDVAMRILDKHVRDKRLVNDYIVDMPVRG